MVNVSMPTVVCLGFFDGVHTGHLALVNAAKAVARQKGLTVCVHTFDRAPGDKDFPLTSLSERVELLRSAGADTVAVSVFDEAMRHMRGDDFFHTVILEKLHARHVVCGDDHRFGYRGAWGVEDLRSLCQEAGIGLTVVPAVRSPGGARVSSTAIREAIRRGDFPLAEAMLGRSLTPVQRSHCIFEKIEGNACLNAENRVK